METCLTAAHGKGGERACKRQKYSVLTTKARYYGVIRPHIFSFSNIRGNIAVSRDAVDPPQADTGCPPCPDSLGFRLSSFGAQLYIPASS